MKILLRITTICLYPHSGKYNFLWQKKQARKCGLSVKKIIFLLKNIAATALFEVQEYKAVRK